MIRMHFRSDSNPTLGAASIVATSPSQIVHFFTSTARHQQKSSLCGNGLSSCRSNPQAGHTVCVVRRIFIPHPHLESWASTAHTLSRRPHSLLLFFRQ
jgi:hypothetical protein